MMMVVVQLDYGLVQGNMLRMSKMVKVMTMMMMMMKMMVRKMNVAGEDSGSTQFYKM